MSIVNLEAIDKMNKALTLLDNGESIGTEHLAGKVIMNLDLGLWIKVWYTMDREVYFIDMRGKRVKGKLVKGDDNNLYVELDDTTRLLLLRINETMHYNYTPYYDIESKSSFKGERISEIDMYWKSSM